MYYKKRFCTVINCMDGRVQVPVIDYLQKSFNAEYVDSITEAGPIKMIANDLPKVELKSIYNRINISIEKHKSVGIAIVGHFNCLGNPVNKKIQVEQIKKSVKKLNLVYPKLSIIGLWVDRNWKVQEVNF